MGVSGGSSSSVAMGSDKGSSSIASSHYGGSSMVGGSGDNGEGLLVDVRLRGNLNVHVGLGGNLDMDIGLSSRGQLGVGNARIIQTSIHTGGLGIDSGSGSITGKSIVASISVGVSRISSISGGGVSGVSGHNHTSRSGSSTSEKGNKRSHGECMNC